MILKILIAINVVVVIMIIINMISSYLNSTKSRAMIAGIIQEQERIRIEKIKLLLSNNNALEKINGMIDELIKEAVDRYMILNVNFNVDAYINKEKADELSNYCLATLKQNMTPEIRSIIGMIHDISDENKLTDFLQLRIKVYVLAMMVNINSPK